MRTDACYAMQQMIYHELRQLNIPTEWVGPFTIECTPEWWNELLCSATPTERAGMVDALGMTFMGHPVDLIPCLPGHADFRFVWRVSPGYRAKYQIDITEVKEGS